MNSCIFDHQKADPRPKVCLAPVLLRWKHYPLGACQGFLGAQHKALKGQWNIVLSGLASTPVPDTKKSPWRQLLLLKACLFPHSTTEGDAKGRRISLDKLLIPRRCSDRCNLTGVDNTRELRPLLRFVGFNSYCETAFALDHRLALTGILFQLRRTLTGYKIKQVTETI